MIPKNPANVSVVHPPSSDGAGYPAYASNLEHVAEELRRLDLALKLRFVSSWTPDSDNPYSELAQLNGDMIRFMEGGDDGGPEEQALAEELKRLEERISARLAASLRQGVRLQLPRLASVFSLGTLEMNSVIACLAPELDRKYERIYAFLQDDLSAKSPTVDFILSLFTASEEERIAARLAFDKNAPLMKHVMEQKGEWTDSRMPLIARSLKLTDWVVSSLLGFEVLDERLLKAAHLIPAARREEAGPTEGTGASIQRFIRHYQPEGERGAPILFYCSGPDEEEKRRHIGAVCSSLGYSVIVADLEKMLVPDADFGGMLTLLGRHARLHRAALTFTGFDSLVTEDDRHKLKGQMLLDMLSADAPLAFILGQAFWRLVLPDPQLIFVQIGFTAPDEAARKAYWEEMSREYKLSGRVDLDAVSAHFRFTRAQIRAALLGGESLSVWNGDGEARVGKRELYHSCYNQSSRNIQALATRITPLYTWDMLVLPEETTDQLREICNQAKYRAKVYGDWGFAKRLSQGKGMNILFSGPPGSGKTMAAEVVAGELSLELFKIDVSQIVSKYIGETEKNLSKIFAEAEASNAILFFDEADALFGKRSEVKDAHDRYANVEVSYLLQKMEEYTGIVILATNLNQNLDEAFLRRLHFKSEFPFPEKKQREAIWRGMFPAGAPVDPELNFTFIAEKFALAGGNIKNIALNAAFYAAHEACPIGMKHIMKAAKREYVKLGKTFLQSDYAPYHKLIEVK